ncbi:hypothetical protein CBR_g53522 [Chara braunii]|uniref:Uncharacterized protein n=1 Tax=Chara braunii TaxID=69332 RepID=A0A388MAW7_CHABU|nr:hypothetical protein CBR_g53522 [Chara braunii]|eukprot:GBG91708.1 hypothetical protein CBR_g53522 [Chara braunii]
MVDSSKKLKTKAPTSVGEKRKGTRGEQHRPGTKHPTAKQKRPAPGPSSPRPPINIDARYFLEYKDGVRTKREFEISPAQVIDLGEWEDLDNQWSLNPVPIEGIKEAMWLAFDNKEQSYELPTLKLARLGLRKPTLGAKVVRLKPEDCKDELSGQYYYNAVCGHHNAAAARSLLCSKVAKKYNFERWPTRMVNFSDDDFEEYFLVSSQDNKDLKAPPRQLKLSMKDIGWQWKHDGSLKLLCRTIVGNKNTFEKGAGSPSLAKLGKHTMQEMVQLVKCDRVLLRLWNYYQLKHDKSLDVDWIQKYPFLKTKSAIFKQFESRGLDDDLSDGSTKYVSNAALFKDNSPYMVCAKDHSIEAIEKLVGHRKLTLEWRNKVLSVLTGSRLKSQEIALVEGIVDTKWTDTGDVTSITPFDNDSLEVDIWSAEMKEAVAATKSHNGGPDETETTNSIEIRSSSEGRGRLGILVSLGEAACVGTEGQSSGFDTGSREGAELDGREGRRKMEEGKEGGDGEEEGEEGKEGQEGGERKLIELLEGKEGAKRDVDIVDDEGEESEDDVGSGESPHEFGQLYEEHREDDIEYDVTAMEMETQMVNGLSSEREHYEVQPLTFIADLKHQFD